MRLNHYHINQKTICALEYVNKHKQFDYIIKTSASTYINVDLLTDIITHQYKIVNKNTLCGALQLYSKKYNIYFLHGWFLVFNHTVIDYILKKYTYMKLCDDVGLGLLLYKNIHYQIMKVYYFSDKIKDDIPLNIICYRVKSERAKGWGC